MGYGTTVKGYKVFSVETEKVSMNIDVKFDENAIWNWDRSEVKIIERGQMGDISSDEVQFKEDLESDIESQLEAQDSWLIFTRDVVQQFWKLLIMLRLPN